jgi:hypothetical protein
MSNTNLLGLTNARLGRSDASRKEDVINSYTFLDIGQLIDSYTVEGCVYGNFVGNHFGPDGMANRYDSVEIVCLGNGQSGISFAVSCNDKYLLFTPKYSVTSVKECNITRGELYSEQFMKAIKISSTTNDFISMLVFDRTGSISLVNKKHSFVFGIDGSLSYNDDDDQISFTLSMDGMIAIKLADGTRITSDDTGYSRTLFDYTGEETKFLRMDKYLADGTKITNIGALVPITDADYQSVITDFDAYAYTRQEDPDGTVTETRRKVGDGSADNPSFVIMTTVNAPDGTVTVTRTDGTANQKIISVDVSKPDGSTTSTLTDGSGDISKAILVQTRTADSGTTFVRTKNNGDLVNKIEQTAAGAITLTVAKEDPLTITIAADGGISISGTKALSLNIGNDVGVALTCQELNVTGNLTVSGDVSLAGGNLTASA